MVCGRAEASAPVRGAEGARIGADCMDEIVEAGAARDGGTAPEITGEPPPFCSSILMASSGVGMSAT